MLRYKIDIIKSLNDAGYNTTKIRNEKLIGESSLSNIRAGKPVSAKTLDTICRLLGCQPGFIYEYVKDEEE